jgi:hypothetical protein
VTAVATELESAHSTTVNSPAQFRELLGRVAAEYAEMPGLSLTLPQAQRLWSIDPATCLAVFSALMHQNVIRRNAHGMYVRVCVG